jgi:phosphoglycolate phosphatase-like HAD superfamily hydrolase
MPRPTTTVFWDIDGTLLRTSAETHPFIARSVAAFLSVEQPVADWPLAGKTEGVIVREIAACHGRAANDEMVADLLDAHERNMRQWLKAEHLPHLPPTVGALSCLIGDPALDHRLLTGNTYANALRKLELARLDHLFHREGRLRGGFCTGAVTRLQIAHRAASECDSDRFVIIGDTPADMVCAKAIGAAAIGVASAAFPPRMLLACGADAVIDHQDSAERLVAAVFEQA